MFEDLWKPVDTLADQPAAHRANVFYLILAAQQLINERTPITVFKVSDHIGVVWSPEEHEIYIHTREHQIVLGYDMLGRCFRQYKSDRIVAKAAELFRRARILEELADV